MALANAFRHESDLDSPEPILPLRIEFCRRCHHVQLIDGVPPAALFQEYLYVSSASSTLRTHFLRLADLLLRGYDLGPADLVVDVGCNDGSLLKAFRGHGVRTLGVDPAQNLAALTDEILEQQAEYCGRGGRFLVPIPEPAIVPSRTPTNPRAVSMASSAATQTLAHPAVLRALMPELTT